MVDRSVVRAKVGAIQIRLRELQVRRGVTGTQLARDKTVQAVILHNYQVAIQACCDLASHIIADQELGIPGTSADLFEILGRAKIIPISLAERFKKHVGLRNLIVHAYDKLNYRTVAASLPQRVRDISRFLKAVVAYAKL